MKTGRWVSKGIPKALVGQLTVDRGRDLTHLLHLRMHLRILNRTLKRPARNEPKQNLKPNPLSRPGILIHGVEQPARDGCNGSAEDPEQGHNADGHEREALNDHGDGQGDDHGEHADAGVYGGGVVDGLEVDGEVVEDDEVGASEAEHVGGAGPDVMFSELVGKEESVWML